MKGEENKIMRLKYKIIVDVIPKERVFGLYFMVCVPTMLLVLN